MRRLGTALLAVVLPLTLNVGITPAAAGETSPDRSPDVSSAEINAALTPPGGIKATQTGGNTLGDDIIRESEPRADGYRHVDTPAMIRTLERLGMNTYVYLVWNSPTDWEDLVEEFAPAAEEAGIKVWVYIVPPSECRDSPVPHLSGRCSRPFETDYVTWAKEIAELSVDHPNVVAWALDDFFSQLTPDEVQQMQQVMDSINPRLGFYTTVYYPEAADSAFYERYEGVIDGVIYPYLGANSNTKDASHVGPNLDRILAQTEPRDLGVLLLAYTNRFLNAVVPPTDGYVAEVVAETLPYMEAGRVLGITLYGLPVAGGDTVTQYNRALSGTGWLSMSPSVAATEPGDYAQASQQISVDPGAERHILEFSSYDVYYDQYSTRSAYHFFQVLVNDEVVWASDDPVSGGTWSHHTVDLTAALQGETSATLALRVFDESGLYTPTIIVVDDVSGRGFGVTNGGFEARGGWALSNNNDIIFPSIDHAADFKPRNLLEAAKMSLRGDAYHPSPARGPIAKGVAMYGAGRLSLSTEEGGMTPPGACARASQVLTVDPDSPRYEVDFWQYSHHSPFPGFFGGHQVTVRVDDATIWQADANSLYPIWLNGDVLQGPVDVTELIGSKDEVTLSFEMCGLERDGTRTNPSVDIGFDNIRTVGLAGRNLGFEHHGRWEVSSDADAIDATIEIAH